MCSKQTGFCNIIKFVLEPARSVFFAAILTAASAPSSSWAEVWKCGGVYTNNSSGKANCKPIEGSKVCGSSGNKFFAPRRMSGSTEEPCISTGSSKSPFVDLDAARKLGPPKEERKVSNVAGNPQPDKGSGVSSGDVIPGLPERDKLVESLEKIGSALGGE
ncbi:MAG: hypothetical protein J5J00_05725 [Deltaproteobacteria bacterium]|nr:hypothetical protein [Deltaproteobacteria bacterium]